MTVFGWSMVRLAAQSLEACEREVALGDLLETGESAVGALIAVSGLAIRRQAACWNSWRPWLAAFGLALPSSFFLMGASVALSWSVRQFVAAPSTGDRIDPVLSLFCRLVLLLAWSWAGGYVVASLSRRTLWTSIVCCCLPALFCLSRFRTPSLSRATLLIFVLPALYGGWQGYRRIPVRPRLAFGLAVVVTALMILPSANRHPLCDWLLTWPVWQIVAQDGNWRERIQSAWNRALENRRAHHS